MNRISLNIDFPSAVQPHALPTMLYCGIVTKFEQEFFSEIEMFCGRVKISTKLQLMGGFLASG